MLKKFIFSLIAVVLPLTANAQVVNAAKQQTARGVMLQDTKQPKVAVQVAPADEATEGFVDEEALEEDLPPPPTTITPEEIIEYETESKKTIRRKIKKQNQQDRENFITTMTWTEKAQKLRELMTSGMSYEDAKKTLKETFEEPEINVKKDEDMEQYIYEKGEFMSNEK